MHLLDEPNLAIACAMCRRFNEENIFAGLWMHSKAKMAEWKRTRTMTRRWAHRILCTTIIQLWKWKNEWSEEKKTQGGMLKALSMCLPKILFFGQFSEDEIKPMMNLCQNFCLNYIKLPYLQTIFFVILWSVLIMVCFESFWVAWIICRPFNDFHVIWGFLTRSEDLVLIWKHGICSDPLQITMEFPLKLRFFSICCQLYSSNREIYSKFKFGHHIEWKNSH